MYEFTPNNDSASKLNEGWIIGSFLFRTNQKLTKAIEKRVDDFNDPTTGPEFRIALQFLLFLATGSDMGRIPMLLYLFSTACIASIQTQILRMFFIWFWTQHYNMIQCVSSRKNYRQRKTLLICQDTAFCPHFFLGLLDSFQQAPGPEALLPYSRPGFATPNRFLPVHRIVPDPWPKSSQKSPLPAIFETSCVRCFHYHIPGAGLSIDSRSQHIEYPLQGFPRRHWLASLS